MDESARPLITVGHSTLGRDQLVALLHGAGVEAVVDVRTAPGSRHNPDAGRNALARWLPAAGIDYRWDRRLGGWRPARPASPDTVWRNASFRGYAGHTRDADFVAAIHELLESLRCRQVSVMCAEALWWRCHRRIIADYTVVVAGIPALHLMPNGRLVEHVPTSGVRRRADGLLVYDGAPG